jgi:hypothetical protein
MDVPGMIPILQAPGVMMRGNWVRLSGSVCLHLRFHAHHVYDRNSFRDAYDKLDAASTASRIESAAAGAGTKTIDTLHAVFCRASDRVEYRHFAIEHCPPFPGVTPATTFGMYSMHCRV